MGGERGSPVGRFRGPEHRVRLRQLAQRVQACGKPRLLGAQPLLRARSDVRAWREHELDQVELGLLEVGHEVGCHQRARDGIVGEGLDQLAIPPELTVADDADRQQQRRGDDDENNEVLSDAHEAIPQFGGNRSLLA